jgi:hypothetical protein
VEHVTAILSPFFPGWSDEEMEGLVRSIVFSVRKYDTPAKRR